MTKNLQKLYEDFLEDCEYSGKRRPETIRGYKSCFKTFCIIMPEIISPKDLNPTMMTKFFKKLQTRKRIVGTSEVRTGIKKSTVATYRNKLKIFFDWLRKRKYIKGDPFEGLPYPKVFYGNRKFLKKADIEKIFVNICFSIQWANNLIKTRNIALYTVLLYCGLRKGELVGIKLLDINLDYKELRVRGETSKSGIDRYVPLNSQVIAVLNNYLEERRKRRCNSEYLWVSDQGDYAFTAHGLKHLNKKIVQYSNFHFHLHQFRHTFAINILNTGSDIYKLKELLGHTDIRMTCAYLRCFPTQSLKNSVDNLSIDKLV